MMAAKGCKEPLAVGGCIDILLPTKKGVEQCSGSSSREEEGQQRAEVNTQAGSRCYRALSRVERGEGGGSGV